MFALALSALLLALVAVSGDRVPPNPFSLSNAMLGRLNTPHIERTLEDVEVLYVTQRVDHFDPQNSDTFLQVNWQPKSMETVDVYSRHSFFFRSVTLFKSNSIKRMVRSSCWWESKAT